MASATQSPIAEQIRQLNDARKHVLLDVKVYSSIVQGILPIIGSKSAPELRRWGADFLAESFATPSLQSRDKETMSLMVLETLRAWVENPSEDAYVVKSAIQTAASIYPLVVRWMYVPSSTPNGALLSCPLAVQTPIIPCALPSRSS